MKRTARKHERMTKAELIQCIKALEQSAPALNYTFAHERLLHELHVHQVELETQNRDLREAQQIIEHSRDRYADLYDFAPVGYVTLSQRGIIRDLNLTAAGMLGVERTRLVGVPFHLHVLKEDLARFRDHLKNLSEERLSTTLRLDRKTGEPLAVEMQSVLAFDPGKKGFLCRSALTDLTARLQAEKALRDNEARLRAILDTAVNGIITIDEQGRIESFNQAAETMFGYAADEVIGQNISLLMPSPHRENHDDYLAHYRQTGERRIIGIGREVSGRRKDGSLFPLDLSVGEVQLAGRRIFTGIVRDVTEAKRVEHALHTSERSLRTLSRAVEQSPASVMITSPTGEIHYVNPRFTAVTGYSLDEVQGKNPRLLKSGLQPPGLYQELWATITAGRNWSGELRNRKKSGELFWEWTVIAPIHDEHGKLTHFVALKEDITERKRAVEALRESEQRYRGLVEAAPDAIFVLRHGRIEFINPEGVRLFGAESAAQVLGRSPFEFFRQGRHEFIRDRMERPARPGGASPLVEEELLRLDGSTRWVTLNSAMFSEDGQHSVQIIMHDITERRLLETELLKATDREQQRIGHELHDGLGQQLTALEMQSYLALEALAANQPANQPADQRAQLEEQMRQINRGLRECISTTRSISHGLAPVVLKSGGLTGALEQLVRQTRVPGRIECRLDCPARVVVHDEKTAKHLYRIAQEAVNNALKHARPRSIGINLTQDRDALRLQITDDGRGLPLRKTRKAGLGLGVMRHRAHVIGAFLDIDSKPGHGVTVTCTLPLTDS